MTLTLAQTATAVAVNISAYFYGAGGVGNLTYAVLPGGAGGSINATTGLYAAPSSLPTTPETAYDMIQVTDTMANTATAQILVASPLQLVCDILQTQLGLDSFHIYLWDQKINQPTDSGLYIAVSNPMCRVIGSGNAPSVNGSYLDQLQYVMMQAQVDLDIISRSSAARDQKELVVMALNSTYAEQQQEANGFFIGRVPPGGRFQNLSNVDGAAIPYRYRISFNLIYSVSYQSPSPYFDTFEAPQINTDPVGESA